MTLQRASFFLVACIIFALGVAVFGYASRDWSTLRLDTTTAVELPTPDQEELDLFATLTALPRPTGIGTPPAPTATPPPLSSGGVTVNGVLYRVNGIADPEPAGFFKPQAGRRIVAVNVTVRAGQAALSYSFTQFKVVGDDGVEYTWALGNSEPKFEQGSLPAGETRTGWLAFGVPEGVKVKSVLVQPPGGGKVGIAAIP